MRHLLTSLFVLPLGLFAQPLTPTLITELSTSLNETSGLMVIAGQHWTQLDSGNPNEIYQVDTATGEVLRAVTVENASNSDWEDIATDGTWLYIGDFGNNSGSRTDLCVYRVPLEELLDTATTEILADTIRFAYADQTDFTPASNANNWDCEAMIALDDSLFLFSKNWLDGTSYLIALPATPGDHLAIRRDTLDTEGLITGASHDPITGTVALVGYTNGTYIPFVWRLSGFSAHDFFGGSAVRHALLLLPTQMEAIAWVAPTLVHMTCEQNILGAARLWELELDLSTAITSDRGITEMWAGPCPAADMLTVRLPRPASVNLFDAQGSLVLHTLLKAGENVIDLRGLPDGAYVLQADGHDAPVKVLIAR